MKTTFCQPRVTGQRFDEHTLPVEVARDLAAYEALVIDLAKHLYKLENPKRERAPKGFAANFRLDIQEIGDGSTKPLLAVVMSGMLALSNSEPSHFERARGCAMDFAGFISALALNPGKDGATTPEGVSAEGDAKPGTESPVTAL